MQVRIIVFLFFTAIFLGCSKVIPVNLDSSYSQIVISGEVTDQPGPYTISITKSVGYAASNAFPPVTNALVTINANGVLDTLAPTSPGNYITHKWTGIPGKTYKLNVWADGKNYSATSTMPLKLKSWSFGLDASDLQYVLPSAMVYDPAGISNYYFFSLLKNGQPFSDGNGNFPFSDRLSDGRKLKVELFNLNNIYDHGDSVNIAIRCIDVNVFNYQMQLHNGYSSPNSSQIPSNPSSNISNNALGYFSANTFVSKTFYIK